MFYTCRQHECSYSGSNKEELLRHLSATHGLHLLSLYFIHFIQQISSMHLCVCIVTCTLSPTPAATNDISHGSILKSENCHKRAKTPPFRLSVPQALSREPPEATQSIGQLEDTCEPQQYVKLLIQFQNNSRFSSLNQNQINLTEHLKRYLRPNTQQLIVACDSLSSTTSALQLSLPKSTLSARAQDLDQLQIIL